MEAEFQTDQVLPDTEILILVITCLAPENPEHIHPHHPILIVQTQLPGGEQERVQVQQPEVNIQDHITLHQETAL